MRLTSWLRRSPARRRDPLQTRLGLTRLEDRRVMASDVVADVGGDFAGAADLATGPGPANVVTDGIIGNGPNGAADVDMYRVTAAAGTTLVIGMSLPPGGTAPADTGLRLFDIQGNELASDDDSGPGQFAQLQFTVASSDTYYIGVSGFPNGAYNPFSGTGTTAGATGDYRLSVGLVPDAGSTLTSAVPAPALPAGTPRSPSPPPLIFADSVGNGSGGLSDVDLFRFTAVAGSVLVAETFLPPGGAIPADTYLRLFDASGVELASNDDRDPQGEDFYSRLVYAFGTDGTYYVGVSPYGNDAYDPVTGSGPTADPQAAGDYALALSVTQPPPVDPTRTGALALAGTIDRGGEVDLYRYTATESGLLAIRLDPVLDQSGASAPLDVFLRILRPDGSLVAEDDDSLSLLGGLVVVPVTAGQTYYIEVGASPFFSPNRDPAEPADFTVGAYRLGLLPIVGGGQPIPLAGGGPSEGAVSGTIAAPGGLQFHQVVVPAGVGPGSVLTLDLTAPAGSNLDPYLLLFDPATGGLLRLNDDRASDSLSSRIEFPSVGVNLVPGQSFLVVTAGYGTTFGSYSLAARVAPVVDDFDNAVAGATDLGNLVVTNGTATIGGEIERLGDRDFVRVRVPNFGGIARLEIVASGTGGDLDPTLDLYDGTGGLLARGDDSTAASGAFTLDARIERLAFGGEELILGVAGYAGLTRGTYALTFRLTPLAAANLGILDLATQPAGAIAAAGAAQLYRFTVPGGFDGDLRVRQVAAPDGRLDSLLRVFNNDGEQIGFNDDDGLSLDSSVTLRVIPGATYFVQAGGYGASTGDYTLAFSRDDAVDDLVGARAVTLDGTGSGTKAGAIEIGGDADVYEVTATVGGRMVITLSGEATLQSAALADPLLTVFDADGFVVARNNDFGGTQNSRVEFDVAAGQTFYVRAAGVGVSAGAYRIDVATGTADDVGNTFADALRIDQTTTVNGTDVTTYPPRQAEIGAPGDADVFVFRADVNGTATLTLSLPPGSALNAQVVVYQFAGGQPVRLRADLGAGVAGTRTVTFDVTRGRDYFVQVAGSGNSTGAYELATVTAASASTAVGVSDDAVDAALAALRRSLVDTSALDLDAAIRQLLDAGLLDPNQTYLVFVADPVDFVISDAGTQRQVGFTATQGQVNESGTAGYSGDGVVELVILPTSSTSFDLQLAGLGSDYRFDARLVSGGTIASATVTNASTGTLFGGPDGALLVGTNLSLALDFGTAGPGAGAGTGAGAGGSVTGGATAGGGSAGLAGGGDPAIGPGVTSAATQFFFAQLGGVSDVPGFGVGPLGPSSSVQTLAFSTDAAQAINDLLRPSGAGADAPPASPTLAASLAQLLDTWQAVETQLIDAAGEALGAVARLLPHARRHDGDPAEGGGTDEAEDLVWSAIGRGLLPLSLRRMRLAGGLFGDSLQTIIGKNGPAPETRDAVAPDGPGKPDPLPVPTVPTRAEADGTL